MLSVKLWVWFNEPTKVTLKENKPLHWYKFGYTDEGWHSESIILKLKDDVVYKTTVTDGADCDGRLTREYVDYCPVSELCSVTVEHNNERISLPCWYELKSSQYDQFAELANY